MDDDCLLGVDFLEKSEAAESIASLEISGINYVNAWARLQESYDNKRLIVQNHINAIFDLPAARKENGTAIRQILNGVLKHTRALQALKRPTDQWDDLLIHIVTSKLDLATIKEWENALGPTIMPNFQELVAFLTKRCQTLEAVANQQSHVSTNSCKGKPNKITAAHATAANAKCVYCKGEHQIYQCKTFQGLTVEERTNQARIKGLCLNCLRPKHLAKDCIAGNCKKCGKKHSSLLHVETGNDTENKAKQSNLKPEQDSNTNSVSCNHANLVEAAAPKQVLLSTAVVRIRDRRGQFIEGRALLDNGSQSNFISEKFMNKLGLRGNKTQIHINGINQQISRALKIVDLSATSRFDLFNTDLKCVVIPCITRGLPAVKIDAGGLEIPNNIRLADPKFHIPGEVDLLIGAEKFWDLVCVGQIKLGKNKPTLQKTTLGWIIAGVVTGQNSDAKSIFCHLSMEESLCEAVNKFWQIEDSLTQKSLTEEEKCVKEFFENTYSRDAKGRFIVKLPVNRKILDKLGDSESHAMKRLLSVERKLKKNPELGAEYVKFMNKYLELGHMRPANKSISKTKRIFLPHQVVIKEEATSTKTRVVFDASSKDSKGLSLNDALYNGPVIQSDLFSILLQFRFFLYVLCADIRKMYRQIRVHEEHAEHVPLQTILWRPNPAATLLTLELLTVTYGQKASAFLAIKCLQKLAELERKRFPLASEVVVRDFYVDDLLTGAATMQGVKDLKKQVTDLLALGGFELHKWNSYTIRSARKGARKKTIGEFV
ncbi:uncharacterized protein LOC112456446 [Temnothorax curvispinosus]|uniref:Uncharacterized protein LOC112456446 n=1 Tax=Temnothorax curvispinosus TaxID=300111 RepID=A0A6J1Q199_9HYME|nr:uncharacterized protein LOC112456446 [Temnothorax curvispinosus]